MKCMLLLTVMSALGFRAEATDCTTGTFVAGTESSCDASCLYTAQSDASCTANPGLATVYTTLDLDTVVAAGCSAPMAAYNTEDEVCGGVDFSGYTPAGFDYTGGCAGACAAAGAALLTKAQTLLGSTLVPAGTTTCEYATGTGGGADGTAATCTETATSPSVTADAVACALVQGVPLNTAAVCEAVKTAADAGVTACTYAAGSADGTEQSPLATCTFSTTTKDLVDATVAGIVDGTGTAPATCPSAMAAAVANGQSASAGVCTLGLPAADCVFADAAADTCVEKTACADGSGTVGTALDCTGETTNKTPQPGTTKCAAAVCTASDCCKAPPPPTPPTSNAVRAGPLLMVLLAYVFA